MCVCVCVCVWCIIYIFYVIYRIYTKHIYILYICRRVKGGCSEGITPLLPITPRASFTPDFSYVGTFPFSRSRLGFCHLKLKKSCQLGRKHKGERGRTQLTKLLLSKRMVLNSQCIRIIRIKVYQFFKKMILRSHP